MNGLETTHEKIQGAWLLRWNQRIEEARSLLADVQVHEHWELLEVEKIRPFFYGAAEEDYLEALLLKGSLMRAQGSEQKSSAWLRRIWNRNEELSNPKTFRLLFELGLDSWRQEDTPKALDYFMLSERKSRTVVERLYSQVNILWCLENLDLDCREIEKKIEDLLRQISPQDEKHITHVREQLKAYTCRRNFYEKMEIPEEEELSGQPLFLQKWMKLIPYTQSMNEAGRTSELSAMWQAHYRLRTLNGIWTPTDRIGVRLGDAIDRLYLWVWLWLADRNISKEKLHWTLESIVSNMDLNEISKENGLLLRNACAWMALVDESLARKVDVLLRRLARMSSSRYPLLEIEFNLIQSLSLPDAQDVAASLSRYPIFSKIFNQTRNNKDQALFLPRLKNLRSSKLFLLEAEKYHVIVNRQTNEVRFTKTGVQVVSPKMALLLDLLSQTGTVYFNQIIKDQEVRVVYNLISRVRRHLSSDCLRLQGEVIYRGPTWPKILILNSEDGQIEAPTMPTVSMDKIALVGSEAFLKAGQALIKEPFTRGDVESTLKISKATANRMLQIWLRDEWIEKKGRARAITYRWRHLE